MTGVSITLPDGVRRVAELLEANGCPAYIVGGAVRAHRMELAPSDFDMAGPAPPEKVLELIGKTEGFSAKTLIERLGTLHIRTGGGDVEYTTFRTESYGRGHTPKVVAFTGDIEKDAFRRDFTCNALYYRPAAGEIVDPTGGIADIEKRILRATRPSVMREDGLRLLRMIRFGAELRFTIEEETYAAADPALLGEIARERIGEEMRRILLADARYDLPMGWGALVRALYQLRETELLSVVLPDADPDDMACADAPAELTLRLASWLKPLGGTRAKHAAQEQLRYPAQLVRTVGSIIADLNAPDSEAAYLLSRNGPEHARRLCALKPAWQGIYDDLLARGAPEDMSALAVSGEVIAGILGGASPLVGKAKEYLFRHVIEHPADNVRERLEELLKRWKERES